MTVGIMQQPVTSEEFDFSMKKLGVPEARPKVAVAVSGGGDSMALAVLMQEWVAARNGEMLALTVDHQLRPPSTGEAIEVQKRLQDRGISHDILTWHGDKPVTHIQQRAREARYRLLLQECRRRGFPMLAVAHNLEDQIETFWMRLSHGSGLDGLSAMAPVRQTEGVAVIRPLLSFPRDRLRAVCMQREINWIEDPSNRDEKYLRVRLRQFEDMLAGEGLTPSRLAQTVQKLEDARQALQFMTMQAVTACVRLHPEGYATLKRADWKEYPRDLQRRVLAQALEMVAAQPYPAGFEALEQTRLDLHSPSFAGKTLAGCEIFPGRCGDIFVLREAAATEKRVSVTENTIWDGRFSISGFQDELLEVGALGEAGLSELRKESGGSAVFLQKLEAVPFKVRLLLPALWRGKNLLAVPYLDYYSAACPRGLKTGRIAFVKIGQCRTEAV